jgi:hypothetical protein
MPPKRNKTSRSPRVRGMPNDPPPVEQNWNAYTIRSKVSVLEDETIAWSARNIAENINLQCLGGLLEKLERMELKVYQIDSYNMSESASPRGSLRVKVYDWAFPFDSVSPSALEMRRVVYSKMDIGNAIHPAKLRYNSSGSNRNQIFTGTSDLNPDYLFQQDDPDLHKMDLYTTIHGVWRVSVPTTSTKTLRSPDQQ